MIKEICVIGHPSYVGGADQELLDQIKCWSKMGIKVYLLHTSPIEKYLNSMKLTELYGCIYLRPRMWSDCKDMHCISFCNGEFLTNLALIKKHARSTSFVNCMTWNFSKEVACHANNLIDYHLYQTEHAFQKVSPKLIEVNPNFKSYLFNPYFDFSAFKYYDDRPDDHFRFGRISRTDISKFGVNQFYIYDSIKRDSKSGLVLGWDLRISRKCNIQKDIIAKNNTTVYKNYIQLLPATGTLQKTFYEFCDVMIMDSDTFENLPRVGFECMASGTVMIVNKRGGWQLQIDNEKTGYLCENVNDFIDKSNLLATNKILRDELRKNSFDKLISRWSLQKSMDSWEQFFNLLES